MPEFDTYLTETIIRKNSDRRPLSLPNGFLGTRKNYYNYEMKNSIKKTYAFSMLFLIDYLLFHLHF